MNGLRDRSSPDRNSLENLTAAIQALVVESGYFLQDMSTSMEVHASPNGGAERSLFVSFQILDPPANPFRREFLKATQEIVCNKEEPRKTNRYDLLKGTDQ